MSVHDQIHDGLVKSGLEEINQIDDKSLGDTRVEQARFLAEVLGIKPETFEGHEDAALPFLKGLLVYPDLPQRDRNTLLSTASRVFGPNSKFMGQYKSVAGRRVALPNMDGVGAKPNNDLVRDYIALHTAASSLGVLSGAASEIEYAGGVLALTGLTAKGQAAAMAAAKELGFKLTKEGLEKLGKRTGIGLLAYFTVERIVALNLQAHDAEIERRLDGEGTFMLTTEEFERLATKHGAILDKNAIK